VFLCVLVAFLSFAYAFDGFVETHDSGACYAAHRAAFVQNYQVYDFLFAVVGVNSLVFVVLCCHNFKFFNG